MRVKQYKIEMYINLRKDVIMATCPNCGKKLHIYNIKAECKACGANIPNYNWEQRLEEDNELAEKKFQSFYRTMNMFSYSMWGTKLRIVRIILSFLPAIGYILPWSYLKSAAGSVGIDLLCIFTSGSSLLDLISSFFSNSSLFFTNMAYEGYSGPITYTMISIIFMLLSVVFIVLAFFAILFTNKKPNTKTMCILDALSILSAIAFAIVFTVGASSAADYTGFNFGDVAMYNASGAVSWGLFVYIALLCAAFVVNIMVSKAVAKTHEELEAERLERKAIKEEKERLAQIEKEKAREEAEKKHAEEQAKMVEEAKAKLEAQKNKKKK